MNVCNVGNGVVVVVVGLLEGLRVVVLDLRIRICLLNNVG